MVHTRVKLSLFSALIFLASACGNSPSGPIIENKQFQPVSLLPNNGKNNYSINLERPDFSSTPSINEEEVNSSPDLANLIQHVRLDLDGDLLTEAKLRIKIGNNKQFHYAQFTSIVKKIGTSYGFSATSEDQKYEVAALCTNQLCEQSSIVLTDRSSKKSVSIRYIHRNEFLKPELFEEIKKQDSEINNNDLILLQEAAEYHFPIVRHTAKVEGRAEGSDIVDLLIIERPPVDESSEDFSADYTEEPNSSDIENNNETIDGESTQDPLNNYVIELESSSSGITLRTEPLESFQTQEEVSAEAPQAKPATSSKRNEQPSSQQAQFKATQPEKANEDAPRAQLVLTSNPNEVYRINIPTEKLRNLTVRNPLQFASFDIVPADQQERYEPAYRMTLIADAFVKQNVKIYKNACNFYVRAVMTLAGYTSGRLYKANDFGLMFNTRAQNLNLWKPTRFTFSTNARTQQTATSSLQGILNNIPESYSTIAQIVRPGKAHGHVGIVTNMNGKTYLFDASLNRHGPRKTEIRANTLFNRNRRHVNVYSIEGLIPTLQRL